ncbi:MAG TPA: ribonuclease III domain-containing protein [Bacteroidales bacterium]|nr:ribonuclease III domain-containing protein [Bacteroidales bacterium]
MRRFLFTKRYNPPIAKFVKTVFGFYPKHIQLFELACTPSTFSQKNEDNTPNDNERLEYLGDALLSAIVADFLFRKYPLENEGTLTEVRSRIVNREQLNHLAVKIGLCEFLQQETQQQPSKSVGGNALEAFIAAIYLDRGFEKTKKIVIEKLILTYLDIDSIFLEDNNFKSKILCWIQKEHKNFEFKHTIIKDEKRKQLYDVKLYINDELYGEGMGYTIKAGEQEASKNAWDKINQAIEECEPNID